MTVQPDSDRARGDGAAGIRDRRKVVCVHRLTKYATHVAAFAFAFALLFREIAN